MKLFIVHSHYRPGGVRRVIELAAPHVAAALKPAVTDIALLGGEKPEARWLENFAAACHGMRVTCAIEPALGYVSEQRIAPRSLARRIDAFLRQCFAGATQGNAVVWTHNPGLGRNLLVAAALGRIAKEQDLPLVFHHHDWWFDNRWARWPEMKRTGFNTLAKVAGAVLPVGGPIRHAAINQSDARVLRRHLGARAGWVPNLATRDAAPPAARVRQARRWLREQLGDDGPVWLVPCRLLRRKNIAEALLLTRWLRPEAWLVTTGGMSSADETGYAAALEQARRRHGWRMRLSVLAQAEFTKPPVPDLLAASEVILLTSLQEGFGLPNLEAAAAHRPLITRRLPAIAPDLARFGFRFPQWYDEVLVDARLFDLEAEIRRQSTRWRAWRNQLPRPCRPLVGRPPLLAEEADSGSLPFSRLTLTAQLEVLAHPAAESWELCAPLNAFLRAWRRRAAAGALAASRWPREAERWLGGPAYGQNIAALLGSRPGAVAASAGVQASDDYIRAKLAGRNQYPLLWTSEP